MKEIDLDKIIEETLGVPPRLMKEGERSIIRDCVKAGINQALDIASEQANDPWVGASILDIKNRVK